MKRMYHQALDRLEKVKNKTGMFRVFVGFDGYVDTLVKPVRTVLENGTLDFFETISDFGIYLQGKAEKSCSVELHKMAERSGGNAAIFSNAISRLGIETKCAGAFGYPKIKEVFKKNEKNLELISVSEPGYCTALEFNDGKVMLSENAGISHMDYKLIAGRIGQEMLYRLFDEADMIALMNWSEVPNCTDIWKGLLANIFSVMPKSGRKRIFVDISDCSRRQTADIREMFDILKEFADYCAVTLSLNQNEFDRVCEALADQPFSDLEKAGMMIRGKGDLKYLVLHRVDGAMVFSEKASAFIPNHKVACPVISTGGGDNFNAGLVFGMMSGMDLCTSVYFANAVSSYYVSHGESPSLEEIAAYIYQCNDVKEAVI